ncbi:hypothetical protein NE237_009302 [Protea cynaroides]|uniref:Uncharacterized protein n=1 Tax=Protea cynaroides TaxID=273540 RepID=A0A9Q0R0H9_9MAGN|nr:hypothetical protein NE237_009302 [Protea cynaroides]
MAGDGVEEKESPFLLQLPPQPPLPAREGIEEKIRRLGLTPPCPPIRDGIEEKESLLELPPPRPPFLEVVCRSSGSIRRFAAGTDAGFALSLINRKLGLGVPLASHIEAVKEGEEPVSFGHTSVLVDYGEGWKLQTVVKEGHEKRKEVAQPSPEQFPTAVISDVHSARRSAKVSKPEDTCRFIGRILLAFAIIFVLGAMFTLLLENLPRLILLLTQSM